jgi:hypothetical protein
MRNTIRGGVVAAGAVVGLVALLGASPAQAAPYGMAGCGLGSVIFGNSGGIIQIFAATTNGTFGSQTFGITTGTSNCVGGGSSEASTKAYVQTNREAISKDIARGSGETIVGLAKVAGCADAKAVGSTLQSRFNTIFPHEKVSDAQVSESVVDLLRQEKSLRCDSLS